jgi:hypothetical protein
MWITLKKWCEGNTYQHIHINNVNRVFLFGI